MQQSANSDKLPEMMDAAYDVIGERLGPVAQRRLTDDMLRDLVIAILVPVMSPESEESTT